MNDAMSIVGSGRTLFAGEIDSHNFSILLIFSAFVFLELGGAEENV